MHSNSLILLFNPIFNEKTLQVSINLETLNIYRNLYNITVYYNSNIRGIYF